MKNRKTVLLVCANGASTSLIVEQMKTRLQEDENWRIEAKPISELPSVVAKYDYILVAPQVNYALEEIRGLAEPYDEIQVMTMNADDFASGNAEAILDQIRNGGKTSETEKRGRKDMSETTEKKTLMDRLSDWMQKYIVPIGVRISNQRHLAAIRDGLSIMIPATIIGGIACLIAIPPIPATITEPSNIFYAFLLAWKSFATAYSNYLMIPYYMTIGIISIYVVCGVAYRFAKNYGMVSITLYLHCWCICVYRVRLICRMVHLSLQNWELPICSLQ